MAETFAAIWVDVTTQLRSLPLHLTDLTSRRAMKDTKFIMWFFKQLLYFEIRRPVTAVPSRHEPNKAILGKSQLEWKQ